MPPKPKYNYDIQIIRQMRNHGRSMREIARVNGWPEIALQAWVNRNYREFVEYVYLPKMGRIEDTKAGYHENPNNCSL